MFLTLYTGNSCILYLLIKSVMEKGREEEDDSSRKKKSFMTDRVYI
jgi:hypothetical protein